VGERTVATSSLALVSLGISGAAQQRVRPQPIWVTASSQGAAPEEAGFSFNRGALRRALDTADTHPARASLARGTWHMAHGTWHVAQAVRSEQADTHGPARTHADGACRVQESALSAAGFPERCASCAPHTKLSVPSALRSGMSCQGDTSLPFS